VSPVSEQPSVDESTWPRKCAHCGAELQTATRGFNPAGDDDIAHGEMDEVLAVDFCPNPDCPGAQAETVAGSRDQ
jgi:hypothetical protein